MEDKLKTLFESRRFWAAAGGVVLVLLLPFEVKLLATILIAAWIIGDSIRSTKAILLAVALSMFGTIATAGDLHDTCREATVRIRNGNSMGSGTLFRESEEHLYVLTNAHVAGTGLGNRVQVEFWKEGHQSRPIEAETVAVAYIPRAYRDIAVVRVDRRALGNYRPPVIPLADSQDSFNYQNIFSVGCPSGRWPTAFEGFALRRQANGGDTIHFVPMPAGGRSGSAIFDVNGGEAQIIGLIAWRSTDSGGHGLDGRGETHGYGIAMTHQEVWAGLSGKQTTSSVLLLVPPPDAVPLSTKVEEEKATAKPEVADGEENQGESDEVILKYSDPFAIERDVESIRAQRLPSWNPRDGIRSRHHVALPRLGHRRPAVQSACTRVPRKLLPELRLLPGRIWQLSQRTMPAAATPATTASAIRTRPKRRRLVSKPPTQSRTRVNSKTTCCVVPANVCENSGHSLP